MNSAKSLSVIVFLAATLVTSASALHSGLSGLSPEFVADCESAQKKVDASKSAEPLLVLLQRYTNATEKAELELSIGLVYNQRTGVVDPGKAVTHFTAALQYEFPERTYIEILMWRGNSQEQLQHTKEALKDYLRGLLACSYHDLSGGWPEILPPKEPMYMNSPDPENTQRLRDHHQYRQAIDFQRFLLMQRYYLIDAVKRVLKEPDNKDVQIVEILGTLSPDASRFGTIVSWLKSENKRPWP
jgi:hypothetical protein